MFSANLIKLYSLTLLACLAIDLTWLLWIAKPFYQKHLGYLLTDNPQLIYGLLFYVLFVAALLTFVVLPAIKAQSLTQALYLGFFFGFIVYSAYDLTNQATIKNWPLIVTCIDMLWGATLAATVSGISFYINTLL